MPRRAVRPRPDESAGRGSPGRGPKRILLELLLLLLQLISTITMGAYLLTSEPFTTLRRSRAACLLCRLQTQPLVEPLAVQVQPARLMVAIWRESPHRAPEAGCRRMGPLSHGLLSQYYWDTVSVGRGQPMSC